MSTFETALKCSLGPPKWWGPEALYYLPHSKSAPANRVVLVACMSLSL